MIENRWWEQNEGTAMRLHEDGYFAAADDIRTLVDGLRDCEREYEKKELRLGAVARARRYTLEALSTETDYSQQHKATVKQLGYVLAALDAALTPQEPAAPAPPREETG